MSMRSLLCTALMTAASGTQAAEFLIDNFDDPRDARVSAPVIAPDQATFLTGGDMFGRGDRDELLPNTQTPPFAIVDDTVAGAVGGPAFPTDVQGIFGQAKTDAYFGVVDLTNDQNLAGTGTAEWTIDISGLSSLALSVDVGAMGNFEATSTVISPMDLFSFTVSIDGGAFTPVMLFGVNEAIEHTYRLLDIQLADSMPGTLVVDPLVYFGADGVLGGTDDIIMDKTDPATGALDNLIAAITGTGTSMVVRFSASGDGADEAFAFDNLKLLSDFGGGEFASADFDEDGFVDADDLATWTTAYGSTPAGDANNDNVTDGADFLLWQQQFTGPGAISAIPEPATALLGGVAAIAVVAAARRRS